MKILAMEPFDRGSHRHFRQILSRHSKHCWHGLRMTPPRGSGPRGSGAPPLGYFIPDVLFCTSLLDVAARVQVEGKIGKRLPTVLYMHENQWNIPPTRVVVGTRDVHFALTNLNSIFAADLVLWNSRWNLESFPFKFLGG